MYIKNAMNIKNILYALTNVFQILNHDIKIVDAERISFVSFRHPIKSIA